MNREGWAWVQDTDTAWGLFDSDMEAVERCAGGDGGFLIFVQQPPTPTEEDESVDRSIEELIEEGRSCPRKNIAKFAERLERDIAELKARLDAHADWTTAKALEAEALQRIHRTRKVSAVS